MTQSLDPVARAELALACLAVDPFGLGGIWLRARPSPARDAWLSELDRLPLPVRKIQPYISDIQLFGGVDLSATLANGRLTEDAGLLAEPTALILTMAERAPPGLPARLGQALDSRKTCLIAVDEGADPDEILSPGLAERLAFFVSLDGVSGTQTALDVATPDQIDAARDRRPSVAIGADVAERLTLTAARLGISSLRAPLFALRTAVALAALAGRQAVTDTDLMQASELAFAHRAQACPEDAAEAEPQQMQEEPETPPSEEPDGENGVVPPEELVLEAALASLPPDILAQLAEGNPARRGGAGSGSGSRKRGNRRGRPLPSRPGKPDGRSPIDIVATLRAAAPWQPMRRAASGTDRPIHIRPADIRLRRYEDRSDRLLIFAVDASGSAAMTRLAEAKGAVEILLGEAYARRDHVALVAFRGTEANLLLPPTRSLVQTKRRLAALPGGGGTPLAAGLRAAQDAALLAQRQGLTPSLVLLTDGRGNIALDGTANRVAAAEDAETAARAVASLGLAALVIDTANRPQRPLEALSATIGGQYIPLPRANAETLSQAISTALDD